MAKLNREDDRLPITFTPDWLLTPKDDNPYLRKEEYFYRPPLAYFVAKMKKIQSEGVDYEKYMNRITQGRDAEKLINNKTAAPLFVTAKLRKQLTEGKGKAEEILKKS